MSRGWLWCIEREKKVKVEVLIPGETHMAAAGQDPHRQKNLPMG